MFFTQGKLFEHAFFFAPSPEGRDDNPILFDEVKTWCNENMSGQWLIFDNRDSYSSHSVKAFFYSRAVHNSPVDNIDYPPAEIDINAKYIVVFQLEEDATAFKLRWDQVNVC